MLRFDQYYSEAKYMLDLVKDSVKSREEDLITTYIQQGPDSVRAKLGAITDFEWRQVFDHLVFSGDVLDTCVTNFMPFFKYMVVEHGPGVLRELFDIWDAKYDGVFERLFDLAAVESGALYDYVHNNRQQYIKMIQAGSGDKIRTSLHLNGPRYDSLWGKIIDMLLEGSCEDLLENHMTQDKIRTLSLILGIIKRKK